MNPEQFVNPLQLLASVQATTDHRPISTQLSIEVPVQHLLNVIKTIYEAGLGYLIAITGLDPGEENGDLWVLYHMAERANVITLKVILDHENPVVPSITSILPAAGIFEQELVEMLGVVIVDPVSKLPAYNSHLFLPDDWPDGIYPLRKVFQSGNTLN
jgi:Ni,Fe-hydrogenase III component G